MRGFVPPDEFIPLAEGSGIMPLLTERVVSLALAQIARWRDRGHVRPGRGQHRPDRPHRFRTAAGRRPRPARARPPARHAAARDHRAHRHARDGRGEAQPRRAAQPGRVDQPRRLRHRLLVAAAAEFAAGRRDQDRPWLHLGDVAGRARCRHRAGTDRPGAHAGHAVDRRGRRDGGRDAHARVTGLRRRAGLARRPADAGRRGDGLVADRVPRSPRRRATTTSPKLRAV